MQTPSINNERELFFRIARGDERAFHEFFHLYNRQLLPYVIKLTGTETAAEEVLQEVFIKVWMARDKLAEVDNPKAWVVRIVSNESFNYLRKQATDGRLLRALQSKDAGNSPSPQEMLDGKEIAIAIQRSVDQLSPQVQRIYKLSKEKGLSIAEIAEQLELSPNTVKNQLVTALKKIRSHVERTLLLLVIWVLGGF